MSSSVSYQVLKDVLAGKTRDEKFSLMNSNNNLKFEVISEDSAKFTASYKSTNLLSRKVIYAFSLPIRELELIQWGDEMTHGDKNRTFDFTRHVPFVTYGPIKETERNKLGNQILAEGFSLVPTPDDKEKKLSLKFLLGEISLGASFEIYAKDVERVMFQKNMHGEEFITLYNLKEYENFV